MPDVEKFQISPHLSWGDNATCGDFSDLSTSVMWRNLKLIHMWRNFRILHICQAQKSEISPHDKFVLHRYICGICDKYEVCIPPWGILPFTSTPILSDWDSMRLDDNHFIKFILVYSILFMHDFFLLHWHPLKLFWNWSRLICDWEKHFMRRS